MENNNEKNLKALVVFHRVDYDGIFSFSIVNDYYSNLGYTVLAYGWNYGDVVNEDVLFGVDYDVVFMADVTLPTNTMLKLKEKYPNMVWCDHHVTQVDESVKFGFDDLCGVRQVGKAACAIVWEYLHPNDPMPYCVKLASVYDVWDKEGDDWEGAVMPFQVGMMHKYTKSAERVSKHFTELCSDCSEVITIGKTINEYLEKQHESWVDRFAFDVIVDGRFKAKAMIGVTFSSVVFKSLLGDDYDLFIVANKNGNAEDAYNVSMYKTEKQIEFSCGFYMKEKYQGGGHDAAAGCQVTLEQFVRLINDKTF